MGRWTDHYDDCYRIPDGMERIGYDSDTHRYTFRDAQGVVWEGRECGGELTRMTGAPQHGKFYSIISVRHDEPIRLMPNSPIPTPCASPERTPPTPRRSSTFHDILPAHLIAPASPTSSSASRLSSKSPLSRKASAPPVASQSPPSPTSQTTSKWSFLRRKSTSAKMQRVVQEAIASERKSKTGAYRQLC
ncbi:hypothetical protein BC835DRAFT_1415869 [Cytidiella melzeri]|nr:hypothetical protein BC835DRAFT_1415869 [Cytidiella melzeri]